MALWLKGATYQQIVATGFGISSIGGAWRAVRRALARIPKAEADQARQAQLARLQEIRRVLWNQTGSDPRRAAEALIKVEAREARLLGLDMPIGSEVTEGSSALPLHWARALLARYEEAMRQSLIEEPVEPYAEPPQESDDADEALNGEGRDQTPARSVEPIGVAAPLTLADLRRNERST